MPMEFSGAYASSLPGQVEFEDAMRSGGVVYGPFGSYA